MNPNSRSRGRSRSNTLMSNIRYGHNARRNFSAESINRHDSQEKLPIESFEPVPRGGIRNFMKYVHYARKVTPSETSSYTIRGRPGNSMGVRHHSQGKLPIELSESVFLNRDLDYNNTYNYNPLFLAAHNGQLNKVHSLLKEKASVHKELNGRKLIHIAAARGHEQMVCLLCKRGAEIDKEDKYGNTPLHLAVKGNHPDVVSLLTNENTANMKNHDEATPLHIAVAYGLSQLVDILLENGAKVYEQDAYGRYPLHIGVMRANLKIISLLLAHGASTNSTDHKGFTPLHLAVVFENLKITELLINHGASININNYDGKSPLFLAVEKNKTEIVKQLLSKGSNTGFGIINRMTPLHFAAQYGNLEIAQLLMAKGYDTLNAKTEEFKTPLYYAAINGHVQVMKYLIERGAEIGATSLDGGTLLHVSATKGHLKVLKYMIERGAEINKKTEYDETPLHLSAEAGHLDIVKELLNHGADIDSVTVNGYSALALAVSARKKKVVSLLLSEGAGNASSDPCYLSSTTIQFLQPLHIAAKNGDEEILKILLEKEAMVDIKGKNDKTALHFAATYGHQKTAEILIKAGAQIDSKTKFMETPLHLAAGSGRSSIVRYLLNAGADVNTKTVSGHTPLLYALDRQRHVGIRKSNESIKGFTKKAAWESVRQNKTSADIVSPFMFDKYLEITEMILIKGASVSDPVELSKALDLASQIRVTKEHQPKCFSESKTKENTSRMREKNTFQRAAIEAEFHPEIVRCILNYNSSNEFQIPYDLCNFNEILLRALKMNYTELFDVILEYDVHNFCENNWDKVFSTCDSKSIVAVVDRLDKIDTISNFLRMHSHLTVLSEKDNVKILVAILVKIRSTSTSASIPQGEELKILEHNKLHEWYKQCELEIMIIRETKIHQQFNITFYDVLTEPVSIIANYVRNKVLLRILDSDSYEGRFPIYALFLKRRIEGGKDRKALIEFCEDCVFNFIRKHNKIDLPSIVVSKIIGYLSVIELRKLSATVAQKNVYYKKHSYSHRLPSDKRN